MKAIERRGRRGGLQGLLTPLLRLVRRIAPGDNARIDRRPPARLNCAPLLQHKRQQAQIPLIALPNVNSQDEHWNEHYPHIPDLEGKGREGKREGG